jgi:hypothetical protein
MGLNDGDISKIVAEQKRRINELRIKIDDLRQRRNLKDVRLSTAIPGYAEAMRKIDKSFGSQAEIIVKNKTDHSIHDIVHQDGPDSRFIVYFDLDESEINEAFIMAENMYSKQGGDVSTNPFWIMVNSDPNFKNELVEKYKKGLQGAQKKMAEIDKNAAKY